MVSVSLIQRCVDRNDFDKLARLLAAPGLESLPLRARLAHRAPATGLALRRVVEMTYGPSTLSRTLAAMLIHLQQADGSLPGGDDRDPIATAAAAAGLGALLAEPMFRADDSIARGHARAVAALASMQDGQGLFSSPADRTWQDRALTSAFVLMVLADDDRFREAVRFDDAANWFEENEHRLDAVTARMVRLARAGRPSAVAIPALAA